MSKDGKLGAYALIDRHKLLTEPVRIKVFPPKTLAVTVKDEQTGRPLAGIDVNLTAWLGRSGDYGGESKTDAAGRVVFSNIYSNGSYSVSARAKGYRAYSTEFGSLVVGSKNWKSAQMIRLKKADMAKGRVIDEQGRPVSGAEIEQVSWEKTEATTDASGNFEIAVPDEAQNLAWDRRANKSVVMLKASHSGRDIGAVVMVGRADVLAKGVTITTHPAHEVTVAIKDTEGKPLKNVEVEAFLDHGGGGVGASMTQRTNEAGETVISSMYHGGNYSFMTELPGYYPRFSRSVGPVGGEDWENRVEFVLERTDRTQQGTVVDADGRPIVGATVTCSAIRELKTTTGEGGKFTLSGLPASEVLLHASFSQMRGSAPVSKAAGDVVITVKEPVRK